MKHTPLNATLTLLAALGALPATAGEATQQAGKTVEQAQQQAGELAKQAKQKAASTGASLQQGTQDAWIDGKLEAIYALNSQLDALDIDTDVERGVVMLSGTVETRVERDLAGELARAVEGVQDVVNELEIASGSRNEDGNDFGQWVSDATITASVKSQLLANANTEGLSIEVDTENDVVTLSGQVGSAAERELAAQIAANTEDVARVDNAIVVKSM